MAVTGKADPNLLEIEVDAIQLPEGYDVARDYNAGKFVRNPSYQSNEVPHLD